MEDYFAREGAAKTNKRVVQLTPMEAAVLLQGVESRLDDVYAGFDLDEASDHVLRMLAEALRERKEQPVTISMSWWHASLLSECVMIESGDPLADVFLPSVQEKLVPDPRSGA